MFVIKEVLVYLGQQALSSLERCPYSTGNFVHISTYSVYVDSVLIEEASLHSRKPYEEVSTVYMQTCIVFLCT